MIFFNSEKKSPLLVFIKFEPTFLTGSLAVCLSAPVLAFTQEFRSGRQGEAGGRGVWGYSASPEPKRSPAALLDQSRVPQKSFLFLLEEKIGGAQNKKCEENFFAGWRASASGGGAERQNSQSGFSSKKVRILTKRHRIKKTSLLTKFLFMIKANFISRHPYTIHNRPSPPECPELSKIQILQSVK